MDQYRSCILTYHSLDETESVLSVSPRAFRQQMAWLAQSGFRVVPLGEVRQPGAVAITFDDAFRSVLEHAVPTLVEFGFPATIFVVSEYCGAFNNWPSQPPGIPAFPTMSWSELRDLMQHGITLGSHTATHPRLGAQPRAVIEREVHDSRMAIEDRCGQGVDAFAYPYGDVGAIAREVVRSEFRLACTTEMAYINEDTDLLNLPRLDSFYLRSQFWLERIGTKWGAGYVAARRSLRALRSAAARY